MLSYEQVFPILDQFTQQVHYETIPIQDAVGRVLQTPLLSPIAHPPFDKSAMDGWAYHASVLHDDITLSINPQVIAAGDIFCGVLSQNECVRIMTGAKIPDGCNAVHRFEYAEQRDNMVHFTQKESSRNIIQKGINLPQNAPLLPVKILDSKDIALLSSCGISEVTVAKMPRIGIISTGDEIKLPTEICSDAQIFESNGIYLKTVCSTLNFPVQFIGIVADSETDLQDVIQKYEDQFDVFIFSGAVSKGDFDLIPKVLNSLNVQTHIHGVKIKPGKPFYFGTKNNKTFFGLPGNPVSTLVCFDVFIKPYLYLLMNYRFQSKEYLMPLHQTYTRKDTSRKEFLPAQLVQGDQGLEVQIPTYTGSTMTPIYPLTEVLVCIEIGVSEIKQNELVYVRFL